MVYSLAERGEAPALLSRLSGAKVPMVAVGVSVAFGFIATVLELLFPEKILPALFQLVGSTCLVVWGTQDVYLPAIQAYKQREPFPSAQIHTIPDVGHWSFLERPDLVAPLVLAHLRSHHSTARSRPGTSPSHRNEKP